MCDPVGFTVIYQDCRMYSIGVRDNLEFEDNYRNKLEGHKCKFRLYANSKFLLLSWNSHSASMHGGLSADKFPGLPAFLKKTAYKWSSTGQLAGPPAFPGEITGGWPSTGKSAGQLSGQANQPEGGNQREFWQGVHLPVHHRTPNINPSQSSASQHTLTSAYPYLRESASNDPYNTEPGI
uniref:Uncharacterized protein n=1 Tax=Ditylenchus dipsaci TaxID=166011 RepID=A0A915CWY3_9BILA